MDEVIEAAPRSVAVQPTAPAEARQLTVVEHLIRSGASPDQLERALELQVRADNHQLELMREKRRMDEEDRTRDAMLAFRRDFAGFRGANVIVPKNKHVNRGKAGSFNQAQFDTICRMLSPALSANRFSFRHDQRFGIKSLPTADDPNASLGWVWVKCYLEHADGHTEALELEGPEGDQSANTPVQNMQLTASYLKRQSLLAITGTATGGEDDENAMRSKSARSEPSGDGSGDGDALLQAGRDASLAGTTALNKWWGDIDGKQRNAMTAEFAALRRAARVADDKEAQS